MTQGRESTAARPQCAAGHGGRRSSARLRRWIALSASGSYLLAGCYTYVPAATAPTPGSSIGFDISDRGRVALGDRLGPGVTRVEGTVTDATADEYVVAVTSVSQLNAGRSAWSGESIRLRREYVSRSEERRLSRSRTALTVGAVLAGVVAVVLTRSLIGSGGGTGIDSGVRPGES